MIEHEYYDNSIGFQYEPGDLVYRVKNGAVETRKIGSWGIVECVTPIDRENPDEKWMLSTITIKVFPDFHLGSAHDSGRLHEFIPFSLSDKSMEWDELTDRYFVYEVSYKEGDGVNYCFAVHRYETGIQRDALLPISLTCNRSESIHVKERTTVRTINLPKIKRVQVLPEVISEVMES